MHRYDLRLFVDLIAAKCFEIIPFIDYIGHTEWRMNCRIISISSSNAHDDLQTNIYRFIKSVSNW